MDANDTFCIIADKDAFPCLGLLETCAEMQLRIQTAPRLNPFFCGKCDDQTNAIGDECLPTDDAIDKGYILSRGLHSAGCELCWKCVRSVPPP